MSKNVSIGPVDDQRGFTLVEMAVAILLLTVLVLGIAATTGQIMQAAGSTSVRAEALQAVEGRIARIQMEPRYTVLDSLFGGQETDLPGLAGYTRTTVINRTTATGEAGRIVDYKTITVSISGPGLKTIIRTIVRGAP
jgi:prepilin-type N-terminal cleavage/methylation domain-containing protein